MTVRRIYLANGLVSLALGLALFVWGFGQRPSIWGPQLAGAQLASLGLVVIGIRKNADVHFLRVLSPTLSGAYSWLLVALAMGSMAHSTALSRAIMGTIYLMAELFIFDAATSELGTTAWLPGFLVVAESEAENRAEWQESVREQAAQQERNRLASDLHDSVKQQIFSIQTNLAAAQARWDTDMPAVQEAIAQARNAARDAAAEISAMLDQLQPSPLESLGLVEALRHQCEALAHRTGAEVQSRFSHLPPLDSATETVVYRVGQEALANVGRHARARHVVLELDRADEGEYMLTIQDDGQGLRPIEFPKSGGMRNMPKRASEIGGSLTVQSKPGEGCTVQLRFRPLAYAAKQRKSHGKALLRHAALVAGVFGILMAWLIGNGRDQMGNWFFAALGITEAALAVYHARQYLYWRKQSR